jgi:rod shape determining protein RodA
VIARLWQQMAIATNWPVVAAAFVLTSLGTVSIFAANPATGYRQLIYLSVALLCMAVVQLVNYQILGRFAWGLYFFSLCLVGYTALSSLITLPFAPAQNGAHCWIMVPGFSFEPSELMKVSLVLVLARYLRFRSNYRTLLGLIPPFLLTLAPVVLILKQPDLGVAFLFLPTMLAMLFVAGAKIRHFLAMIGLGMALVPIAWLSGKEGVPIFQHLPSLLQPYQRLRVEAMLGGSDFKTLHGSLFQQERALEAAGSGGLIGKGPGNIPIGQHVPEAHNDMIFAIIGEQFGLIGSLAVLLSYIVLFAAGVEIAAATREPFARLVAIGIVSLLATQAFLNLAVVMKMFPVTGVTLPFVSAGGSSLLASFISAGLLLNIGQNRPLVMAKDPFEFD